MSSSQETLFIKMQFTCAKFTCIFTYVLYVNILKYVKRATSKVTLCSHKFYHQGYFILQCFDGRLIRGNLNLRCMMFYWCKLYICIRFGRMLNSRAIKLVNISENKVLANHSEFTIFFNWHQYFLDTCWVRMSTYNFCVGKTRRYRVCFKEF